MKESEKMRREKIRVSEILKMQMRLFKASKYTWIIYFLREGIFVGI